MGVPEWATRFLGVAAFQRLRQLGGAVSGIQGGAGGRRRIKGGFVVMTLLLLLKLIAVARVCNHFD